MLDEAKAKLQSLGIDNLSQAGDMTLHQPLTITGPGLFASGGFQQPVHFEEKVGPLVVTPQAINRVAPFGVLYAAAPAWPQTESVIIADTLDLTNQTITIWRERVTHLWIIVRRLTATSGARIAFTPLVNPGVGAKGTNGTPNPAQPDFNPETRQNSENLSNHNRATDGGNGHAGDPGAPGPGGLDGPSVTIVALEIDALPDFLVPGQQGGRGGVGGRGADGGDGQRGRDSDSAWWGCDRAVGWGGYGGHGGDGGAGGRGGTGGRGGDVRIATQEDQIIPLVTAHAFAISNGGGAGGDPGLQGEPGRGGRGGLQGYDTGYWCDQHPERRGRPGDPGQRVGDQGRGDPGLEGTIQYTLITKEQFQLKLEGPWITSLDPEVGFAGDQVIVHGLHFVAGVRISIDDDAFEVPATFNRPEQINFLAPTDLDGGEHVIRAVMPAGDISNDAPFAVRPFLESITLRGAAATTVGPGDKITLHGTSFDPGVSVIVDNQTVSANRSSNREIDVAIPSKPGEDPGGEMRFMVQNPDGLGSNEITVVRQPSLDSGFRAGQHGYAFKNFKKGNPTWGDFVRTFGAAEVSTDLVLYPILTGLYYWFYDWYLSNKRHCSAMAATSLQQFSQGRTDLFLDPPTSDADPPPLTPELMSRLMVVQGRLLSKELITHYGDQSEEGIARIEKTVREIEADFRDGLGESSARVLCFIPAGAVWDILLDPDVRQAFEKSHCVVPTRIVYPDADRGLDGARLYIYDNNFPGDDEKSIELFEKDGSIHFKYTNTLNSENSFTLGTATLKRQLTDDVNMPFSGVDGVVGFVVDLVLSPAQIRVERSGGRFLGFKDGSLRADSDLGYICPWYEKCLLVRTQAGATHRRIVGQADGVYTYASLHPNGRSLTIKDALCSLATQDEVVIDPGIASAQILVSEDKTLDLHIAQAEPDGTVRYVNITCALRQGEEVKLDLREGLDGFQVAPPSRGIDLHIVFRSLEGTVLVDERVLDVTLPAGNYLDAPTGLWGNLAGFDMRFVHGL